MVSIGGGICSMVIPHYIEQHPNINLILLILGIALIAIPILIFAIEKFFGYCLVSPFQKKEINKKPSSFPKEYYFKILFNETITGQTNFSVLEHIEGGIESFYPFRVNNHGNGLYSLPFLISLNDDVSLWNGSISIISENGVPKIGIRILHKGKSHILLEISGKMDIVKGFYIISLKFYSKIVQ